MPWLSQDRRQLLSKLTWRKIYNAAKIYSSFYWSKWLGKPKIWGLPFAISIEPTTACNLRCPECPSGLRSFSRATGNLKKDFYRQILDEISDDLIYLTFYFQGEPYINPDFLTMVEYAKEKGIYTSTSTNAHFLDDETARRTIESGLDRLIISIDGTTQEVYEAYRKGGQLSKVIEGTKKIIYWKNKLKSKTPHLIFQFLVVKPNEHQISEVYRLAQDLGLDEVLLKTAQVYDYEQGNPLIPDNPRYSRYVRGKDGKYRIKHKLLNQCWRMWHSCVITWNGLVVPCCFDKDAQHRLGNLRQSDQNFKSIWQGPNYQDFRARLLKGRSQIDICKNCTEGCKVWTEKE